MIDFAIGLIIGLTVGMLGIHFLHRAWGDVPIGVIMNEAAAEIERLNRELDDVWDDLAIQREDNASFGDAFKRMTSEIERLRAALREIDHARYTRRNTINPDNAFENAISLNEKLIAVMDIARAALAEEAPCSSS